MLQIMKSLKKQSKKALRLDDLGHYLKLISIEYPELKEAKELAEKVSDEFNVKCTEKDILGYHELHVEFEDYELESRRQEHGIIM